jgi:hypothetical protein
MGEERIMMEVGTEADARGLLQGHTGGRRKAVRGYTSYTSTNMKDQAYGLAEDTLKQIERPRHCRRETGK